MSAVVDVTSAEPSTVLDRQEVTVTALGIPHGNIPALALSCAGRADVSIVFSTDQTGTNPTFTEFARDGGRPDHGILPRPPVIVPSTHHRRSSVASRKTRASGD